MKKWKQGKMLVTSIFSFFFIFQSKGFYRYVIKILFGKKKFIREKELTVTKASDA